MLFMEAQALMAKELELELEEEEVEEMMILQAIKLLILKTGEPLMGEILLPLQVHREEMVHRDQ